MRFMVAAQEDDHLVARMLIRLSRSESCISWRKLLSPSRPARRPQLPPTWGKRGTRSRFFTMEGVLTAKREEARRASPTTPLSWSGGSGTSESACEEPCSASPSAQTVKNPPARRRKVGFCSGREPAMAELGENGGEIRIPRMESLYEDGEHHGTSPLRAPAGAGSPFGPGSAKVRIPCTFFILLQSDGKTFDGFLRRSSVLLLVSADFPRSSVLLADLDEAGVGILLFLEVCRSGSPCSRNPSFPSVLSSSFLGYGLSFPDLETCGGGGGESPLLVISGIASPERIAGINVLTGCLRPRSGPWRWRRGERRESCGMSGFGGEKIRNSRSNDGVKVPDGEVGIRSTCISRRPWFGESRNTVCKSWWRRRGPRKSGYRQISAYSASLIATLISAKSFVPISATDSTPKALLKMRGCRQIRLWTCLLPWLLPLPLDLRLVVFSPMFIEISAEAFSPISSINPPRSVLELIRSVSLPCDPQVAEPVAGFAPPSGPAVGEEETAGRFRAADDDEVGSVLLVRPGKKRVRLLLYRR